MILKLAFTAVMSLQFTCCTDRLSSVYILEMPQAPEYWISLLGQPHWKAQWYDQDGKLQSEIILPGRTAEIKLPVTWINPVTVWPFWPERGQISFKPAGALFPFDCSGNMMILTWEAGVDAFFYNELASANTRNEKKIPSNFDWRRFRELFKTDALDSAVIKDPWLVDWNNAAEKSINSNFDKRRLVPQTTDLVNINVPSGVWYGSSPFSEPLSFAQGENPSFPLTSGSNVWVSAEGILRTSGKTWVYTAWQ